jgi:hypothetical protein
VDFVSEGEEDVERIEESSIKVSKYVDELEVSPMFRVAEKVRREPVEVRQAFLSLVIVLLCEELELAVSDAVMVLEHLKLELMLRVIGATEDLLSKSRRRLKS